MILRMITANVNKMNKIFSALLGAAVIASCGPEIPAGSESAYQVELNAASTRSGKTLTTTLTEAKAYVHGFKLFASDLDTNVTNVDLHGPFYVDLLTGNSTPVIPTAGIAAGLYRGLSVHLGHRDGQDTSALYVEGEKDGVPFVLDVKHPLHLMYRADSAGFQVDPNTVSNFTVYLDLAGTLDAVDFSGAVADSAGVLQINRVDNEDLYKDILEAIGARGERGERHVGHDHHRGRGRRRG
jgi:hypothetical protein